MNDFMAEFVREDVFVNSEPEHTKSDPKLGMLINHKRLVEPADDGIRPKTNQKRVCRPRLGHRNSDETADELNRKREQNRLAAAKCRGRKNDYMRSFHENYQAVTAANRRMKEDIRMLREQLMHWRMLALQHSSFESGCDCDAIRKYNANRALLAALGAGGLGNWEDPSFLSSQGSNGSDDMLSR